MATLREQMEADATAVFLDTDDFAQSITLTHPAGTVRRTRNQLRSMMRLPPVPDAVMSRADRRHWLGWYRFGEANASTETADAVFDQDNLDVIQGSALDTEFGRRLEEFAILELAADVTVVCDKKPEHCTYATIGGERWNCIRVLGRDDGMQSVAIVRHTKISTKRTRVKP